MARVDALTARATPALVADQLRRSRWRRLAVAALLAGAVLLAGRALGLTDLFTLERLEDLRAWVEGHGVLAPLVFIGGYAVAELLFVPGLPLTVLGGVLFGPVRGTVYVSVGATLGAALAFLAARYAARDLVAGWVAASPRLRQIDAAVAEHGWRILMVTRLVPLFPFNLQNFAYGLTRISLGRFVLVSWLCMLPGTAAYAVAAGALVEGRGDLRRTLALLGVAGVLLVGVSLIPRWLRGRGRAAARLIGPE
jgi:uncharacterized membrane protein YdjX (TVP38/TMEM64 family)